MSVSVATGVFSTGTGAAGTTVVVSGLSFQPKAIIFFWNGRSQTTDTSGRASAYTGQGFATGSASQRAVCTTSFDALATSNGATNQSAADCIVVNDGTNTVGKLAVQSLDSGGFTLNTTDQMPFDMRVMYIAYGGTDITDVAIGTTATSGTTGNVDITAVGFQPDMLFVTGSPIGTGSTANGAAVATWFGAASSPSDQAIVAWGQDDTSTSADTGSYGRAGDIIGRLNTSTPNVTTIRASLNAWLSNGFQLNYSQALSGDTLYWLAIKGGSWKVSTGTTATNTTPFSVTMGHQPAGIIVASVNHAQDTAGTATREGYLSIGAATSPTDRASLSYRDVHNTADTQVSLGIDYDSVYTRLTDTGTIDGFMDVSSFDSNGVTFVMDDADSVASWFFVVSVASAGSSPQTLTPTRYDNTNNFFAPTVTRGAVHLTPARYDNTNIFYSSSIKYRVTVPKVESTVAFFSPTVLRGSVTLSVDRLNNINSFFSPTVNRGAVSISQSTQLTNNNGFFSLVVSSGGVVLSVSRVNSTVTFFNPSITTGAVSLLPSRINSTVAFFNAGISTGAVSISPLRINSTATLFNLTVTRGAVDITVPRVQSVVEIFNLTVQVSNVTLLVPRLDNVNIFYPVLLQTDGTNIYPPRIDSTIVIYAASISTGNVTLLPNRLNNNTIFFNGAVRLNIVPNRLNNNNTFFNAAITTGEVILEATTLVNNAAIFAPVISYGRQYLIVPRIDNINGFLPVLITPGTLRVYASRLENEAEFYEAFIGTGVDLHPIRINSTALIYTPKVAYNISPPLITNTSVFYNLLIVAQRLKLRVLTAGDNDRELTRRDIRILSGNSNTKELTGRRSIRVLSSTKDKVLGD